MLPSSSSSSAYRGIGGSLQVISTASDRTSPAQPLSELTLRSGAKPVTMRSASLLTLPTVLLELVRSALIDRETLQLLLTSRFMSKHLQAIYKMRLRPEVAQHCVSPIVSCQNTVNLSPAYLKMGQLGDSAFTMSKIMKTTGPNETGLGRFVRKFAQDRLLDTTDFDQLRAIFTGVTLGTGGTLTTPEKRKALLECVLAPYATRNNAQIEAAIMGICIGLGGPNMKRAQLNAVLTQILASFETANQEQMVAMIIGMCGALGNSSHARHKEVFLQVLGCRYPVSKNMMSALIQSMCSIFGGKDMPSATRDFVIQKILATYKTKTPQQMGELIWSVCSGLGEELPCGGTDMSRANLNTLLRHIIESDGTSSPVQVAAMLHYLFFALGGTSMTAAHSHVLAARIRQAAQAEKIINMLKTAGDRISIVDILELDGSRV